MPVPTPEDQILKSRSPTVANSDDWPEFELTNVFVHALDDPTACRSLLDAHEFNPLTVVGQLEPLPVDLVHLSLKSNTSKRTERIEIKEVRTIAYGQYADQSVALWAAGKAGWFSVKPGRAYRKTFRHMSDAVALWYTIVDAYTSPQFLTKNKNKQLTTEERFELFLSNFQVQEDAIHEHLDFLLSSMVAGKEGIAWESNPIFVTLKTQYSERYSAIQSRTKGSAQKGRKAKGQGRQGSVSSEGSSMKRGRGRNQSTKAKLLETTTLDSSDDSSKVPATQPSRKSKAPSQKPSPKKPGRNRKLASPASALTGAYLRDQAWMTPHRDGDRREPHAGRNAKSSLRPRPSAGKKAAGRGSGKTVKLDESDDSETSPRSSPMPGKRKREEDEDTTSGPHRSFSRQRLHEPQHLQPEDEGIDIPSSPSSVGSSVEARRDGDAVEPIKSPEEVLHQPDPVQQDTWACALDGCNHKVYCASLPGSQKLIREHYALHAYDDDERVQMVKNLRAPSLPVQHLMEKVRLQAKSDGFPGSRTNGRMGPAGDRFPTITSRPVMQRY